MRKYKIRLNRKKFRRRMFGFLLILILIIGSIIFVPKYLSEHAQKQNPGKTTVRSTDVSYVLRDSGGVKVTAALTLIQDYFTTYYTSMGTLKTSDLTKQFDMNDALGYQSALINQAAMDYMIVYRSSGVNDLGFANCTCGVTITDVSKDGDSLTVKLVSDEEEQFAYLGDTTSSMCGIEHTFVLKKTDNGYLILSHEYEDSAYLSIEETVQAYTKSNASASNEELKQVIDSKRADLEEQAKNNLSAYETQRQSYNANPSSFALNLSCDHVYNRNDAVSYSDQWVGETEVIRNDSVWETYDYAGGNCSNYVSQCVYAGGIPMDAKGNQIWKWYSDTPDSTSAKTGRSPSWTQVDYFYDYCSDNTGYGIAAEIANNLYSADLGDVVIMDWGDGWSHVVMITQVVKDANGNVTDYLINSNTSDRKNYPLSAYGCVKMSVIRIAGWNN